MGVSSLPSNKTIYSFFSTFFLLLAIESTDVNDNMIFKCVKLVQILSSVDLMWVCLPRPAIRPFIHFLVHFHLLLAIETLNVSDNTKFKCVKLVQILSSVVLLCVCPPCPAIRPFVHFSIHFFLLLVIESTDVNDNRIFKYVKSL